MTEQNIRLPFLRNKSINLTSSAGVYLMKDKSNKIIYVGKAKNLKNRVSSYFGSDKNHQIKVISMVLHVWDFDYIMTDSEFEALVLENSLIKQHQPKYNILLKDDKGYSYIKITPSPWSKISESKKAEKDGCKYIGPYMSSWSVKTLIDEAQKIFKLPSCNKQFPRDFGKARPCLNFYINQCFAPCTGKISEDEYSQIFAQALEFIKNGSNFSIKILTEKMEECSENLDFEKAGFYRDRIIAIKKMQDKQKIFERNVPDQDVIATATNGDKIAVTILKFRSNRLCDRQDFIFENQDEKELVSEFILRYYENHEIPTRLCLESELPDENLLVQWLNSKSERKTEIFVPQKGEQLKLVQMCKNNASEKLTDSSKKSGRDVFALEELGKLLNLKTLPRYIESYDISNLQGSENVAGMIVYKDGKPLKSAYKRFKIKFIDGQDDYGSMREVLTRRFNEYDIHKPQEEGFGKMPDLILLDGGKTHVAVIQSLLKEMKIEVPVFGMVKDNKHKTRAIAMNGAEIAINSNRQAFTLVSNIQDEVHRYAISYHRNLRKKNTLNSSLLEIEGIGKNRATLLLKEFKTIKNISNASLEELKSMQGMSEKIAQNVINYFNSKKN